MMAKSFTFAPPDPETGGRFLELVDSASESGTGSGTGAGNCRIVRCTTNAAGRDKKQGTAFLSESLLVFGSRTSVRIRCRKKTGRMKYFFGVCERERETFRFPGDSNADSIAKNAFVCLENLKAACHTKWSGLCTVSAPPSFHEGSVITIEVDATKTNSPTANASVVSVVTITIAVDTSGFCQKVEVPAGLLKKNIDLCGFVSLYNRGAEFEILDSDFGVGPEQKQDETLQDDEIRIPQDLNDKK